MHCLKYSSKTDEKNFPRELLRHVPRRKSSENRNTYKVSRVLDNSNQHEVRNFIMILRSISEKNELFL